MIIYNSVYLILKKNVCNIIIYDNSYKIIDCYIYLDDDWRYIN